MVSIFSDAIRAVGRNINQIIVLSMTYLPFMNLVFETEALSLRAWIVIISSGFVLFGLVELDKSIKRWKEDGVLE